MEASRLEGVPLFEGVPTSDLSRIATEMREVAHPVGGVLVHEGDLPSTFLVILEGTVTVHRDGVHLADLGAGDFVGEVGVVSLDRRNATVIATTPVRAAVLMGWTMRELVEQVPGIAERIDAARTARAGD